MLAIEDGYVAFQAARGQLSHFNVSTPTYVILYNLIGVAATTISIWTAFVSRSFFTKQFPDLSPAYLWGIRLGIGLFLIFSLQGLVMGIWMTHTIGGENGSAGLPVVNWSKTYGDLRIAYFLGMHALQVIPILAYYVFQNVKVMVLIGLLYGLMTAAIFVQALQEKPLLK